MIYLKNTIEKQTVYFPKRVEGQTIITTKYQEKTVELTGPGTFEITPDEGFQALSKVIVKLG